MKHVHQALHQKQIHASPHIPLNQPTKAAIRICRTGNQQHTEKRYHQTKDERKAGLGISDQQTKVALIQKKTACSRYPIIM